MLFSFCAYKTYSIEIIVISKKILKVDSTLVDSTVLCFISTLESLNIVINN